MFGALRGLVNLDRLLRPHVVVDRDSRVSLLPLGGRLEIIVGAERVPDQTGRLETPNPLGHIVLVPRFFKFNTPVVVFSGETPEGLARGVNDNRVRGFIPNDFSAIAVSHSPGTARVGLDAIERKYGRCAEQVALELVVGTTTTQLTIGDDGGYRTCRHTVSDVLLQLKLPGVSVL